MKKRLRGLLALTLALCMGLTMTVSAVSAADYYLHESDSGWGLYQHDGGGEITGDAASVVKKGDIIHAYGSGGSFIRVDSNGALIQDPAKGNADGPSADVYEKSDPSLPAADTDRKTEYKAYLTTNKDYYIVTEDSGVELKQNNYYYASRSSEFLVTICLTPYTPPAPSLPPISYKIKYVAEDGAESGQYSESFTAGTTGSAGAIASAEELGFTKEGFREKPQWLLPDGTVVETGAAIKDVFSQLEDNAVDTGYRQREIILTAQWEDIRYTVKYDANGGAGIMEDQIFTVDQEGVLTKNAFVYEGYDFSGWNTAADGAGTAYADEATVMNLAKGGETITLYAQWTEIPETPVTGPDGSEEDPADDPSDKDEDKDAAGRDDGSGKTDGEQAYDHSAATGDDTNVLLWTFLAMLAMLTAGLLTSTHRKRT